MPATPSDHRSAAAIATRAGELLVELRGVLDEHDAHPGLRRAVGDKASHDFIVEALNEAHPDDAVLSEEGADDPARVGAPRVWIVDPLDGTREYSEDGRTDWAVHVALVIDGEVAAAAVALPAHHLTLTAEPPPTPPPPREGPPLLVVSRTRPPAVAGALAQHLGGVLYPLGSAGAKAMAVVLGEADIYAHSGGQYEWDSAAPVGVAAAAGLHVSRLDGSPLVYNRPDPWLPDLLICRPELAEQALEITTRF
ncbi:MAG TPA: 3'(2'),5'-bisphosphate nucleotidase CysQ [Acidimicrobiia bacterium]|jgi:3'(2'), 5'-bisphosphate nucleotidase